MAKPNNSIKHVKLPNENVRREIIPSRLTDDTYVAELPTLTQDSKILLSAISVTYAQLGTLISNNQLLAGAFYRITDFVTTTAQPRTQSAGHQFDLIVHAISSNELSEDANATQHSGDTYFANSNLKAWVLKYSYANNADKYTWADTVNGKGVIYYMKDEFHNECGYDFKNIQFARYKVTACTNAPGLVDHYYGVLDHNGAAILSAQMTLNTSDYKYFYTFDCLQTDFSMNAIGTTLTRPDGTTFTLNQIQCTKCMICPDENDSPKFYLNNFTILMETNRDCMIKINGWCQNTTFLGGASNVTINTVYGCMIGAIPGDFIDGYACGQCTIGTLGNSLILCKGSTYAISLSNVEYVISCCLVAGTGRAISGSTVGYLSNCVFVTTADNGTVIQQSYLGYCSSCNITCTTAIILRSNIQMLVSCNGSGAAYYINLSKIDYMYGIVMADTNLNAQFISYSDIIFFYATTVKSLALCNILYLRDSTLNTVRSCNFKFNLSLTCNQYLNNCNFESDVSYLNISSIDTTQDIINTNFHDITGTSESIKAVVIPEDYSQKHTVDIYSSNQLRVYEID